MTIVGLWGYGRARKNTRSTNWDLDEIKAWATNRMMGSSLSLTAVAFGDANGTHLHIIFSNWILWKQPENENRCTRNCPHAKPGGDFALVIRAEEIWAPVSSPTLPVQSDVRRGHTKQWIWLTNFGQPRKFESRKFTHHILTPSPPPPQKPAHPPF